MAKKYTIEKNEDSDAVSTIQITETKSVVTEIDVMSLIREKIANLQVIEKIKDRNKEITAILKDINDNTEIKMVDIPEAKDILK